MSTPAAPAPAPAVAAPAAKPSIADEFLTAFAADAAPAAPAEGANPPEVDAQAPAPSEEGTPPEVPATAAETEAKTDAPKSEPPPPSLARRLATVAAAERRAKAEADARKKADDDRAVREAEAKPILEKIAKAKGLKSKVEAARVALDLDDEAQADLYLELEALYAGQKEKPKKDPAADLDKLIKAKVDEELKARDTARVANEEALLNTARVEYTAQTLGALDADPDAWPLVAIARPSQVDITAISEAWLAAEGEIPPPETVLKLLQEERQKNYDERRKSAEDKAGAKKTAPVEAKPAGEKSGPKAKPIPGNEARIKPPGKVSIEDEFLNAYRAQGA